IFFISSSTIHRFKQHPDIVKYIDLPKSDFNSSNYLHIHRLLVEFYKSLIPSGRNFHIAGFSIKKGSNIYGLVFGSGHILGMKKFLEVAWDLYPDRGEADFDIDEEGIDRTQPSLWPEMDIPRKLMKFEQELASQILCGKLKTNNELYLYTIENGFLLKHSRNLVNRLIKDRSLPKQKIKISDEAWKEDPQPIRLKGDDHG
ncbi:MAG: hypothetical protein KC940_22630, partial [Candidatus Omnitrophica bacterium]|nr:hypothetical protein [Candidatus Omnitrophota bacterium]